MSVKQEECKRVEQVLSDPDIRRHFLVELRSARAAALADAEAFDEVLFAIERLGAFLAGDSQSLGKYIRNLRLIAEPGVPSRDASHPGTHSRLDRALELMTQGRNDALHQGAVARHMTSACVEVALMLENGMISGMRLVKDLMVESPAVAKQFETIGSIRRTMLLNSFSYLPVHFKGEWWTVSDAAMVRFLRSSAGSTDRKRRLGTTLQAAFEDGLELAKPPIVDANTSLDEVLERIDQVPLLVMQGDPTSAESLRGLVTAFDLL